MPRIPEFVADNVGRVIYDQRYHYATGSMDG